MSFDLNIQNYNKKELIDMFELPNNYQSSHVETQEVRLKESIIRNKEMEPDMKSRTIQFLNEAKNILIKDVIEGVKEIKQSFETFYNTSNELKPSTIENPGEHDILERAKTPYLSSYPSDFFPGTINPLKKRITRQNLNIDTRFRENYYNSQSSNYHLDLPLKLSGILTMQLTSIELPTSYYNISKQAGNNFCTIKINETGEYTTITIPDGNYTNDSLIDFMNTNISKLTGYLKYIYFTINISSNGSGSGQIVIGINDSFLIDYPSNSLFTFTLDFQADKFGQEDRNTPLPLKFGWILGFRNGVYVNNYSYVSEGILDLSGPRYIYLVIDDFNNNVNNSFFSAFNPSILNKNILARISLQSGMFSIFSENNLSVITFPRQYFGPVDVQKMTIQLLDEYGRILDLNNMDYSFCLTFQSTYDL